VKALSIRQPWAWAILHAGKRIENRDWRGCSYRGPLLIHAAAGLGVAECLEAIRGMTREGLIAGEILASWPGREAVHRGGIVGVCNVVDVVRASSDPWFCGPLGLVLADVRPLPFVPWKGALGLFEVPDAVAGLLLGGASKP
jgi:hypothetical protein